MALLAVLIQGKHDVAQMWFRRALAATESSLGSDHVGCSKDLTNIADLLGVQVKSEVP